MVRINEEVSAQNPSWNIVMAQNISASGILFNFDHYLEPGTQLQFKITLPSGTGLECDGQVVRNVMGASRGYGSSEQAVCAVAAVFRNIAKEDQQTIREVINQNLVSMGPAEQSISLPAQRLGAKKRAKRIDRSYVTRIQRGHNGEWELVTVCNISESGILFNYGQALEIGRELSFSMILPFSASPVVCRGKVVRVKDESRSGSSIKPYTIGVAFSGLDATTRTGLRRYGEQIGRD